MLRIKLVNSALLVILSSLALQISKVNAEQLTNTRDLLLCRNVERPGCFKLETIERFDSMRVVLMRSIPSDVTQITIQDLLSATIFVEGYVKDGVSLEEWRLEDIDEKQYQNLLSIIHSQGEYSIPGVSFVQGINTRPSIHVPKLNINIFSAQDN